MPKQNTYEVTAIEKFMVKTIYRGVKAENKDEAERKCRESEEAYDEKEIIEGGEEWINTVSVEEQ